jgi:CheY-like chemotaxis protein
VPGRLVNLLSLFDSIAKSLRLQELALVAGALLSLLALVLWRASRKRSRRRRASKPDPAAPPALLAVVNPEIRSSLGALVALACRASDADLESRNPDPAKVAFNVRLLVFGCARTFAARAESKALRLKTAVGADVPRLVRADRSRILLALANLMDNAVKFTDDGVVRLEVVFAVENARPHLRFNVYDTGVGIDSETLARILGNNRDNCPVRHGLFVFRRMIALMGGTMGAESEPRGGSTFWFSVPVEIVEPAPVARPKLVHQSAAPAVAISPSLLLPRASTPGKRILIVDKNPARQISALWAVRALGYSGEVVSSGGAALEAWRSAPFDLVVLDCGLSDAEDTIRGIRRLETGCVPIVVLNSPISQALIPATAIDGSLTKPLCLLDLAQTLDQWLGVPAAAYTSDASSDKLSLPV